VRVLVAHSAVADDADPSTRDVLDQAAMAARALGAAGLPCRTIAVPGGRVWERLESLDEAVVFNLLEAPPGAPQLHAAATAALELLDVPFTGSPAAAIWLTTDKIATRALLADAGLPVAPGGVLDVEHPGVLNRVAPPWIVKPAWEDASVGLDGEPVCTSGVRALARASELASRFPGQPILAEHFLPGREFNVSLLDAAEGVRVLPIAEIEFVDFPPGLPPLVGYEAKWEEGSFADTHTVRRFPEGDDALLSSLGSIATTCWRTCGLAGYARVDIRLDEAGTPYILEVNANPCLAPGAGFLAAAAAAGLSELEVVRTIVSAALRRAGRPSLAH
jgi:D-alanine-D-alanine ligase